MILSPTAIENIPEELKLIPRWLTWCMVDGKKIPNGKVNDQSTWTTFEKAVEALVRLNGKGGGLGFVFTPDDDLCGVDLDASLSEDKTPFDWAKKIIDDLSSYCEVSPSGVGVKIICKASKAKISPNVLKMPGESIKGKTPAIEIYSEGRYFAITGDLFPGSPKVITSQPFEWHKLINFVKDNQATNTTTNKPTQTAGRNNELTSLAGAMRKRGMDHETILSALRSENKKRYSPPLPDSEVLSIAGSIAKYDFDLFVTDQNGKVLPTQANIRTALSQMGIVLSYNSFADRHLYKRNGEPEHLDDKALNRFWLEMDETFHFKPTKDFFVTVLFDQANQNSFHPVQDYLNKLEWDGKPRIDSWLIDYGGAGDSEYCRAIGALVLIGAVRRIRKPGCKFDEILVFENPKQGTDKSSAIESLCPESEWFSDNLPLNSDSKVVIEQTSGKWIIEAAELSGMKKSEVENLKAFLSRRVDVARMSYDRVVTERPRHFVVIGTTNSDQYLKDSTGNRRFWPLRVKAFDLQKLRADRDQLWAEAAFREAKDESIRLSPNLWSMASIQQERRVQTDPWEEVLDSALGKLQGKLPTDDVWAFIGKSDVAHRTQSDAGRLNEVMKRLGFERRKNLSIKGKTKHCFVRGEKEIIQRQIIRYDIEEGAIQGEWIKRGESWEWKPLPASTSNSTQGVEAKNEELPSE